jgi:hypothetical protein
MRLRRSLDWTWGTAVIDARCIPCQLTKKIKSTVIIA